MARIVSLAIAFVFGASIGSFLNLVVYRLPRGESIVFPPSHCPNCGIRLVAFELIPIISFIILRGRCSHCRAEISYTYPLVEILMGTLLMMLYNVYGISLDFANYAALSGVVIVSSGIDFAWGIIPDAVNAFGFAVGIVVGLLNGRLSMAILGAITGFVSLGLIYWLSRGGMGAGDVKHAATLGMFLGPKLMLLCLFIAFVSGAVVGIGLILFEKAGLKSSLPFGPFLGFGSLVAILMGDQIIHWYLNLL